MAVGRGKKTVLFLCPILFSNYKHWRDPGLSYLPLQFSVFIHLFAICRGKGYLNRPGVSNPRRAYFHD